ncbi:hypothetical protein MUCCIDRAFT_165685 [Mucor lusitanicus CBS 277.49]|uniref:Uncharacterized protein n=1 Tax=Mucor lusitanicus CBS 277.49 TaxID=747725 RepID=A0A168IDY4_MUCCL|nr:hypothetical protein MUCCIDRAFT_165685 [Mucor lusitanicus CBS 277.49]
MLLKVSIQLANILTMVQAIPKENLFCMRRLVARAASLLFVGQRRAISLGPSVHVSGNRKQPESTASSMSMASSKMEQCMSESAKSVVNIELQFRSIFKQYTLLDAVLVDCITGEADELSTKYERSVQCLWIALVKDHEEA